MERSDGRVTPEAVLTQSLRATDQCGMENRREFRV
jgi:hypothetical protein